MATTAFRDAAAFQMPSLGVELEVVWVPHPVQNRSPEELEAMADEALDAILEGLVC